MRTRIRLQAISLDEAGPARALEEAGLERSIIRGGGILPFAALFKLCDGSEELVRLRAALARHGIDWLERWELVWSARELRDAELLVMRVSRTVFGVGGGSLGTHYERNTPARAARLGRPRSARCSCGAPT